MNANTLLTTTFATEQRQRNERHTVTLRLVDSKVERLQRVIKNCAFPWRDLLTLINHQQEQ